MPMTSPYSRECIARAARIYHTNRDAALALGIHVGSFTRLCRQHGIQTPMQRRKARRARWTEEQVAAAKQAAALAAQQGEAPPCAD